MDTMETLPVDPVTAGFIEEHCRETNYRQFEFELVDTILKI